MAENNPDHYKAIYKPGLIAARSGRNKRASKYFEKALDIQDEDPGVLNEVGRFYLRTGKLEKAKTHFFHLPQTPTN